MKYKIIFFLISLLFLVPGIYSLIVYGLKPSIDFSGGSLLEIQSSYFAQNKDLLSQTIGEQFEISSIQDSGEKKIIIRGSQIDDAQKQLILVTLVDKDPELKEMRFETVGPILGKELLVKTLTAVAIVSVLITLYVGWRFTEIKYGVCAVLAMFHDTLILLGSFSLLGHFWGIEVDVLFVTALLTTLSFSVHDTIVVYDRIREKQRKVSRVRLIDIINAAVIETLSRSINNSITIIIMLLSLSILGGDTIRWFAVALLIGSVTGTYSSTFTAAPLILLWDDVAKRIKNKE